MSWRGLNRRTGSVCSDAAHIQQSIQDILTTPVGSRLMRREYGSDLFSLIDKPQSQVLRLQIMAAVVIALTRWEPRISITQVDISPADQTGRLLITLTVKRVDNDRTEHYQATV